MPDHLGELKTYPKALPGRLHAKGRYTEYPHGCVRAKLGPSLTSWAMFGLSSTMRSTRQLAAPMHISGVPLTSIIPRSGSKLTWRTRKNDGSEQKHYWA